ncbi:MAG: hypothetical protein H0V29_03385 [Thermoleophilaceae bacterium]|nr:hypothetical protein [Thermoleophilaceae bacterium]
MRLFVCYGTFTKTPRPGGHPCGNAYESLKDAGYEPDLVKAYGLAVLPDALANWTSGRKEVKRLSADGNPEVPLLETDSGEVIQGSKKIIAWAQGHPRTAA